MKKVTIFRPGRPTQTYMVEQAYPESSMFYVGDASQHSCTYFTLMDVSEIQVEAIPTVKPTPVTEVTPS